MLSKRCTYGLRTILFLAAQEPGTYVSVRAISRELSIPGAFLAKIVQELTQAGFLTSQRGPGGGVAMARPASSITMTDIIEVIDGKALFTVCVLGLPGCGQETPCPLHDQWKEVRSRIQTMLAHTSVAGLAALFAEWHGCATCAEETFADLFLELNRTNES